LNASKQRDQGGVAVPTYSSNTVRPAQMPDARPARAVTPDLMGLDLRVACASAAGAGVRLSVVGRDRERGPWDVVIAQSPSPGTRLRDDWQVHVLVDTRPAPMVKES